MDERRRLIEQLKGTDDFWKEYAESIVDEIVEKALPEAVSFFAEVWLGNTKYHERYPWMKDAEWTDFDSELLEHLLKVMLEIRFGLDADKLMKVLDAVAAVFAC